jgi:ABC-2 type transport system permease protein
MTTAAPSTATGPGRAHSPRVALFRNEARLLLREPAILIWASIVPLTANVAMAILPAARRPQEALNGLSVWQTYLPVLIIFSLSMLAIQTMPAVVAGYREAGILRRLQTTPVRPAALLSALVALVVAVGLVMAMLLVLVPLVWGNRIPGNPITFAVAVLLTLVCFVAVGACVTAVAPSSRFAMGLGTVVTIVIWFSAGLWVPRAVMPDWMATICDVFPGGAASTLFYEAMAGAWPSAQPLLVLAVWTATSVALAVKLFRWG